MAYPHEARTAIGAAFIRATHVLSGAAPHVFCDDLANQLLTTEETQEFREYFGRQYTSWQNARWFRPSTALSSIDPLDGYMRSSPLVPEILCRQAFAEEYVAKQRERPLQYLIIGAGLDTFSSRNRHSNIAVYEIDRSAVSEFKRTRVELSGLKHVGPTIYLPIELGHECLKTRLLDAGANCNTPTVVSLLGVTPYLDSHTMEGLLRELRSFLPRSSTVVFDYTEPVALDPHLGCPFTMELASRLEKIGDPLKLTLTKKAYEELFLQVGGQIVEHLTPSDIQARYFYGRTDGLVAAPFVCLAAAVMN